MEWILILLAMKINDSNDIPAKVILEFPDQITCEKTKSTLQYWIKFESFKVIAKCERK